MFIRPADPSELEDFEPDFTVINCCSQVDSEWEQHNLNSDTAVVFNVEDKKAVIMGTWYGGENKKGIFSLMNYWLPMQGHFPMHCSANVGQEDDVALFFGLSGTGKTTLSADPHRALIGDDEHGWDNDGVFNFEGGCYAKTINLSEKTEPDIYRAIHQDALLENVAIQADGKPDYFDTTKTENGRVSYPIFHIPGYVSSKRVLTCSVAHPILAAQTPNGGTPQEHCLFDLRRLWRYASRRQVDDRSSHVPFPFGLHGQGSRYRTRHQGTHRHLFHLFWCRFHDVASHPVR